MERKFKVGEKVWNVKERKVDFVSYHADEIGVLQVNRCGSIYSYHESYFEPYNGQDKVNGETQKERNSRLAGELIAEVTRLHPEIKPTHPFTVILKSGVKIGIDEKRAKQLNVDIINGVTSTSIVENKIEVSGVYFEITQIAAIVPTENLT